MKHRVTTWLICWLLTFSVTFSVFGQSQAISHFDHKMVPPTPASAQLGVFGNVTPDLHTGAVQISVPLPEVKSRQLSLPISLDYHYTGLLVDELPSWVGLGWTLRVGGVITRTVRGLPDELPNKGYIDRATQTSLRPLMKRSLGPITVYDNNLSSPLSVMCQQVLTGEVDTEPDVYSLATPFYSGKIIIDSLGRISCSPHADIAISGSFAAGWTVVTGDGTRYTYGVAETSTDPDALASPQVTAWYLSDITSADDHDVISLQYREGVPSSVVPVNTVVKQVFSKAGVNSSCDRRNSVYWEESGIQDGVYPQVTQITKTPVLAAITTPIATITFISDSLRADIAPTGDQVGRRLTAIRYQDVATGVLKAQYALRYTYFDSTSSNPKRRRLCLTAVQELGKPAYRFQYYTGGAGWPARNSFGKDHWGYYNGTNPATLIPTLPDYLDALYNTHGAVGAIRTAQGAAARLGILEQVQYPTGGWTRFEYEPNQVKEDCNTNAFKEAFGEPVNPLGRIPPLSVTATGCANGPNGIIIPPTMTDLEAYFASNISIGGGDNGAIQNVKAQLIDAPYGFVLTKINCTGTAAIPTPRGNGTSNGCETANNYLRAHVYRVAGSDTTGYTFTKLATAIYTVTSNIRYTNCATDIIQDDVLALQGREFPAGKYYLIAEANQGNSSIRATITATFYLKPDSAAHASPACVVTREVGGLRLKRTIDLTGQGDSLIKTYRYQEWDGTDWQSSGRLFVRPKYHYTSPCGNLIVGAADVGKASWLSDGFHVGYGRVAVESRRKGAGTTVYHYWNDSSPTPNARNSVTQVEEFNQAGALVKQTTNLYAFSIVGQTRGIRLFLDYIKVENFGANPPLPTTKEHHYHLEPAEYTSFWPRLIQTTEQTFGTDGTTSSQVVRYSYLPNGPLTTTQPVRTAKRGTNGQWLISTTRYSGQFGLAPATNGLVSTTGLIGAPALGLAKLVERHLISVPVEHQQWIRTGADSAVIGGDVTHFANLRPARIFALTPPAPIPAQQFVASHLQGTFQQDSRYLERVAFPRYSPAGSLLQQRVAQAPPSSYLWGYAETKLLAEVTNAAYSQIAYTSFEPDARGSWRYNDSTTNRIVGMHVTGQRGYELDPTPAGSVRRAGLPAGEYELLVWGHGANAPVITGATVGRYEQVATAGDWRQHRYRLTVAANASVQLNAPAGFLLWIDELRLHPVGAQMSSYTYDPLVGTTSQTDPSGRTTTYEYDAVGRLVRTRDEQGRIRAQQDYRYARPN